MVVVFQMVDRFDEGIISPDLGAVDYKGLYKARKDTCFCFGLNLFLLTSTNI